MSITLTQAALDASQQNEIQPQLILEIDGVDTVYGVLVIKRTILVGDLLLGDPLFILGGKIPVENQETIISFSSGTSSEISQTLNLDKGTNESISSMRIALVDKSQKITRLITPGEIVTDILGRKVKIWMGLPSTAWKEDHFVIFRGIIDSVDAKSGVIILNISSPDSKKKTAIFPKGNTELTTAMLVGDTTSIVTSSTGFLAPYIGASGVNDTSLKFYVKIDDEIMRYTGTTATTFTGLTRGQLGTVAAAHDIGASVESFYTLEGNAIDLALKIMLSGKNGPYKTGVTVTSFNRISSTSLIDNTIFFQNIDLETEYNPIVGDYITTTGATNGANNVTDKVISEVVKVDNGYYLLIAGVTFIEEEATSAVISFRSQYDVLGLNAGMKYDNDEVDIAEHLDIQSSYLSSFSYRFYLKDTIDDGQDFLASEIYNPMSTFSIPRKARSSLGIHIGPIPGEDIKELDSTNVVEPSKLNIQRSINKNFYNSIIYKFDENASDDKFKGGQVTIDATSIAQIPIGNKPLLIESKGMRTDLSAINNSQISGQRRIRKYKFGAEYIQNIMLNFKTGFDLEIGDKIVVDLASLSMTDINSASRDGAPRLFEISNKKFNVQKGSIAIDVVDTNFSLDVRYCLISPSSFVKSGVSQTEFVIEPSFNTSKYGTNEYKKWEKYIGAFVKIHSTDFATSGTGSISSIIGNTIILDSALGFTPASGYIMELGDYSSQPDNIKLIYGFMSDGVTNFADGGIAYQMS
jgi:hypothetical protein